MKKIFWVIIILAIIMVVFVFWIFDSSIFLAPPKYPSVNLGAAYLSLTLDSSKQSTATCPDGRGIYEATYIIDAARINPKLVSFILFVGSSGSFDPFFTQGGLQYVGYATSSQREELMNYLNYACGSNTGTPFLGTPDYTTWDGAQCVGCNKQIFYYCKVFLEGFIFKDLKIKYQNKVYCSNSGTGD